MEILFGKIYDPKFNYGEFGKGGFTKHTKETRQKMSENHADFSGENNPMYNKNHSKESRKKMSKANKGEKHWNYNKTTSDETKIKMSESKNSSGYFRVVKQKSEKYKQGFIWRYQYYDENGKRKFIRSVDIEKLEAKVKAKGLKWERIENG
jgi:group I intron endonuclease